MYATRRAEPSSRVTAAVLVRSWLQVPQLSLYYKTSNAFVDGDVEAGDISVIYKFSTK